MIKEKADELIKALRSGKYKQGKNKLRSTENEYCCLGVASDISNVGHWENSLDKDEHFYFYISNDEFIRFNSYLMIDDVQNYFGFKSKFGCFVFQDLKNNFNLKFHGDLTQLNDKYLFDFNQIADFIEANWEVL